MFFLKKLLFKFLELGMGIRPSFTLETRDPIFLNFKLSPPEAEQVRKTLPPGFTLDRIRFAQGDPSLEFWVSYNLYEIRYPKKELSAVRKARCEINTYVRDPQGRAGIYVFCGSPYVSREESSNLIGRICDFAERLVIFIYGCGKLARMNYRVSESQVQIDLSEGSNQISLRHEFLNGPPEANQRLSDDYYRYNDISFFNRAATFDLVNATSAFWSARFARIEGPSLKEVQIKGPFFSRPPDAIYLHRGCIPYFVSSLNRSFGIATPSEVYG
jgi:hypothetical protein